MNGVVPTVFAASVLGSMHCAGMCGGLVAFATGSTTAHSARRAQLAYHSGRLATYTLLGAVAGSLGKGIDVAGELGGISQLAAALAGAAMVVWGSAALLAASGVRVAGLSVPAPLVRAYALAVRRMHGMPGLVRAATLGLASALLPCGWLYAFVVTAAGTGSAADGAVAMVAFWAGTLPMLVGIGSGVRHLAAPVQRAVPKLAAVALVVVGALAVWHRSAPILAPAAGHACCHEP